METLRREMLKERFIDYAVKQDNALNEGKGKISNRYHRRIWTLYREAKAKKCIDVFKECINYPNLNVRLWAIGFIFALDPQLAKRALKAISTSDPFMDLSVKAMMEDFNNGHWESLL